MNEQLLDDLTVEVSARIGAVQLSAREVLALQPGQVVPLERPIDGYVELLCGTRVVALGQLVDVDGVVGVRLLSMVEPGGDPGVEPGHASDIGPDRSSDRGAGEHTK